jgi:curved DNA-binding protein CbpA
MQRYAEEINNPWLILGVGDDADDEAIKAAWLKWIKRYPPDRDPHRFQQIQQAYERLKNRRLRAAERLFKLQAPTHDELLLGLLPQKEPCAEPPSLSLYRKILKSGAGRS